MEPKEGVVIYKTMYQQYKRLLKYNEQSAAVYINALLEYAFEGIEPDEDSEVWLFGFDGAKTAIDNASVRYLKAKENGATGGRKRIDIDIDELEEKYRELKTWAAVAKYYGVTDKTIRRIREDNQNGKNGKNGYFPFPENGKNGRNGKNLNINININNDIEENNIQTEKMVKTEFTEISDERKKEIKNEILFDGFAKKLNDWLPDDKLKWDKILSNFYDQKEINWIKKNYLV